jgi:hypothetical protein
MLKHTLILPDTNARLSARLLREAVDALDVILMLVFGKGPEAEQIVRWADQLCAKTETASGVNVRRVVWIRDASRRAVRDILDPLVGAGDLPSVAVLNFHDQLKGSIAPGESVNPIKLELLFAKGHE